MATTPFDITIGWIRILVNDLGSWILDLPDSLFCVTRYDRTISKAKVLVAIILKQDKSPPFPFGTLRFKMSPSPLTYQSLLVRQPSRRIVIIGAGIVGSAIASNLSLRTSDQIVVRASSTRSNGQACFWFGNSLLLHCTVHEAVWCPYSQIPQSLSL